MRKQELVQLHALCSEVRGYVERRYDIPDDTFDRYERTDVPPMAIYRKKHAHEEALDRLLSDLTAALATHVEASPESPSAGTDPSHEGGSDPRSPREEAVRSWD